MAKQGGKNIKIDVGGIGGDMQGVIAGEDVEDVNISISIGGQPTPVDKEPTVDEFKRLLADIRQEIAEIAKEQELLKKIDPSAPFTTQGAEENVKTVAEKVEPEMEAEEAQSVQKSLTTALTLLNGILDGAKTVAEKADEVAEAVKPIVRKLGPLVQKLGVAALWATKLWLMD
jgi:hypothetical protein